MSLSITESPQVATSVETPPPPLPASWLWDHPCPGRLCEIFFTSGTWYQYEVFTSSTVLIPNGKREAVDTVITSVVSPSSSSIVISVPTSTSCNETVTSTTSLPKPTNSPAQGSFMTLTGVSATYPTAPKQQSVAESSSAGVGNASYAVPTLAATPTPTSLVKPVPGTQHGNGGYSAEGDDKPYTDGPVKNLTSTTHPSITSTSDPYNLDYTFKAQSPLETYTTDTCGARGSYKFVSCAIKPRYNSGQLISTSSVSSAVATGTGNGNDTGGAPLCWIYAYTLPNGSFSEGLAWPCWLKMGQGTHLSADSPASYYSGSTHGLSSSLSPSFAYAPVTSLSTGQGSSTLNYWNTSTGLITVTGPVPLGTGSGTTMIASASLNGGIYGSSVQSPAAVASTSGTNGTTY